MNLNAKDKKILAELDLNARAPFQELGKKTRLSKETVIYRIKNLEKKGIIQRYTTLVNWGKLGYTGFGVYNRFQNVNESLKKEIIEYLSKIPELYWIATIGGKFDIVFGVIAKSVYEFNTIHYQILAKYGNHLVDNSVTIRTELRQNKRDYLTGNKPKLFKPPYFGKKPEIEELDELDSIVLSLMSNNARMSIIKLAQIIKKPASTIALRIKNLEKRGIIQAYTTYIKSQNYGMQSYRLLFNLQNMEEKVRSSLFSYAYSNPKMVLAIETVGKWNFEITIEVESQEELQKEISKLRREFSDIIKNVEFIVMFENDLIYDPYPLKKVEREKLLK
ncbi:Lrp/AsnC family transcriptional regulator [Candidatus Woesearchaeota archaeon]|jgi:DNA-binding Lrp family transcriptional regulator|nr:Lrp/AsnC family transcriptional regulator [Candidatus Woesearchaeota archaeon]MBT4110599.1 Lrp/AsnC family transcriptional regulator [Candidatus Woesearchaeota archaeon]MBT4335877.1 Lrp/AsnC family transcriptional regulator [Candidatus Woesearchaeota archaeon]MBT4469144.1 Lrp/AsnC family transcriptional regulator [Candidatus Woesearchaeota archaeon]MBT6744537.1 Lrp/AsnC family transcriptional regulator [Candidatus Woesearchaeota archaeon]